MKKYVIINADDFGLTEEINRGIAECFEAGVVTNASLIINEKGSEDAVQYVEKLNLPVGLHINLFCRDLPEGGLFGTKGKLRRVLREREDLHTISTPLNKKDLEAVYREFQCQLQVFTNTVGGPPNHLDYHLGLHFTPEIFDIFVRFAEEHSLPFRWGNQSSIKPFYEKHPHRWIDSFNGPHATLQNFLHILDHLGEGINEISVHPGYRSKDIPDSYNSERENELKILLSDAVRKRLKKADFSLTDYSAVFILRNRQEAEDL